MGFGEFLLHISISLYMAGTKQTKTNPITPAAKAQPIRHLSASPKEEAFNLPTGQQASLLVYLAGFLNLVLG